MSLQDDETPQADETVTLDENGEILSDGDGSELAPDATDNEKVTFDEDQQAVFDNAMNKGVRKFRDAERETERMRAERDAALAKIPKETRPDVPEAPEAFDDDFEQRLQARDKAIADRAAFDARQDEVKRIDDDNAAREQREAAQSVTKIVTDYAGRAEGLGITAEQLKTASDVVNGHGVAVDVIGFILEDEKGPAITQHLAANPQLIEDLRDLSPGRAAIFIETKVKPFITGKKSTDAPDPHTTLEGGGSPPGERGPPGAEYT